MGSDQERKLAIAQTRYMDKQKLTSMLLKEWTDGAGNQLALEQH